MSLLFSLSGRVCWCAVALLMICLAAPCPPRAPGELPGAAGAREDECAVVADEEGYVDLFDGKSLTGWEGDRELWKVVDGCIVGDSPGIRHNQFLATERKFSDFELRLEFRLKEGKGNSGVQFRSKRVPGSTEVSGYQADIGEQYWGCLYDESRRNKVLAQSAKELERALRKEGWNSYTIRAVGNRITLSINDVMSLDYVEEDVEIARDGIIALQVHSGPPLKIEFKNIRIRELKVDSD